MLSDEQAVELAGGPATEGAFADVLAKHRAQVAFNALSETERARYRALAKRRRREAGRRQKRTSAGGDWPTG